MTDITKDLPSNIILKDINNPFSAVSSDGEGVYKYSYNPKTGRLLYSQPGAGHVNAIEAAGDGSKFDEYVRVIYDHSENVAGSRVWGDADIYNKDQEAHVKSFDAQYDTFQFFKKSNPGLKWALDLTQNDISGDDMEELDIAAVSGRLIEAVQMEELKKALKSLHENKLISIMLKFLQGVE